MAYEFSAYSIPLVVAVASLLLLGVFVLRREGIRLVSSLFALITFVASIWLFSFTFVYSAANEQTALIWTKISYLGIPYIAPAVYTFATAVLGIHRGKVITIATVWIASALFSAAAVGTDWLISGMHLYSWGYYPIFGWLGLPFILFFSSLLIASAVCFRNQYRVTTSWRHKRRIGLLLFAFSVGYLGAVDFLPCYGIPLYPFGYLPILGFVLIAFNAIRTYRLSDITPAFAAEEIVATMSDALLVLDRNGLLRLANNAACEMLGYERDDLIAKPLPIAHFGLQLEDWNGPEFKDQKSEVRNIELSYTTPRGEEKILSISASVMRNIAGDLEAMVAIARDITEQKRAEERIHRQNEYMAALHETSLAIMHRLHLTELLDAIIVRAASLVKSSEGYVYTVAEGGKELILTAGTGVFRQYIGHLLKPGEGLAGRVWITGAPLTIDDYATWSGQAAGYSQANFHEVIGVPLRISDLGVRSAEPTSGSALRTPRSEIRNEVIGVLGLSYLDEERVFGPEELDILTKFAQIASIAIDNARLNEAAHRELAERKRAEEQVRILNVSLEERVVERTAQLQATNQELEKEIEERKRAEEERSRLLVLEHEARSEAEEAVRAREVLLSIVSHDMRNLLTVINSNANLLRRQLPQVGDGYQASGVGEVRAHQPPTPESSLHRIELAYSRLNNLISELLDFGRLQSNQPLDLYKQRVDIVALAREVAILHEASGRHQIVVTSELPSLTGLWDASRLERVLDNVVSNAIKYSPSGGTIEISISLGDRNQVPGAGAPSTGTRHPPPAKRAPASSPAAHTQHPFAILSVRDQGIGIPEDELPHIFEWFRRAGNISRRISGSGIGLASVLQVVEQHGGSITVQSEVNRGSTFTIQLPLGIPLQDAVPSGQEAAASA